MRPPYMVCSNDLKVESTLANPLYASFNSSMWWWAYLTVFDFADFILWLLGFYFLFLRMWSIHFHFQWRSLATFWYFSPCSRVVFWATRASFSLSVDHFLGIIFPVPVAFRWRKHLFIVTSAVSWAYFSLSVDRFLAIFFPVSVCSTHHLQY